MEGVEPWLTWTWIGAHGFIGCIGSPSTGLTNRLKGMVAIDGVNQGLIHAGFTDFAAISKFFSTLPSNGVIRHAGIEHRFHNSPLHLLPILCTILLRDRNGAQPPVI